MIKKLTIGKTICPIRNKPSKFSILISEALFGETFEVKKIFNEWAYGTLLTDSYSGWLRLDNLIRYYEPNYKVISIKTIIKQKPNIKANSLGFITIGGLVEILEIYSKWAKIRLNNNVFGFIPSHNVAPIDLPQSNYFEIARKLIGTPYLWGGRSPLGIDCSALIQIAFNLCGFKFPRDTKDQLAFVKNTFMPLNKITTNCILFWDGHVALTQNKIDLLHANASTMSVEEEPIIHTVSKINKITNSQTEIFKIPNSLIQS